MRCFVNSRSPVRVRPSAPFDGAFRDFAKTKTPFPTPFQRDHLPDERVHGLSDPLALAWHDVRVRVHRDRHAGMAKRFADDLGVLA